ncbi:MAG: DNA/RNA helicase domain-containing protein [Actinoallomurus sp.]
MARAVTASAVEVAEASARRFADRYGRPPDDAEYRSWLNSWPFLLALLVNAGLGDLWLELEYELPGSGERIDALLLGVRPGGPLVAIVIELKQWSDCEPIAKSCVVVGGSVRTHPCRQTAGYVRYLRTWVDPSEVELDVRGVALLHNAGSLVIDRLRKAAGGKLETEIALLGRDDAADPAGLQQLPERLSWPRLLRPGAELLETFMNARHRPSLSLFGHLREVLSNDSDFILVGRQQEAQLHVLGAIQTALDQGGRHVIAVTGGPGTGKTVIAARLLADIPQARRPVPARYLTPSGTLKKQLARAADDPGSRGLFVNVRDYLDSREEREVLLIDEAQRIGTRGSRDPVSALVERTPVSVFFLDERQIIRPYEGVSVERLEEAAYAAGATFTHVDLQIQFRCAGSQYYQSWIDLLLSKEGRPERWSGEDYDFGVLADPSELQTWVDDHTAHGVVARISAGFCWPWRSVGPNQPLRKDVDITYLDRGSGLSVRWAYPWNSKHPREDHNGPIAPRSEYWATDPSGHRQVGCIYTAQGLEYDYSAVILGPDLVRRGGRWEGRPTESCDGAMRDLTPAQYLPLALNTYRVLMTRGTQGCRLYSTDTETQRYLETL